MSRKSAVLTEKQTQRAKGKDLAHQLNGQIKIMGEVITFNARSNSTHKHKDVVEALKKAGLDEKMARALRPTSAFTRACKKLEDEAVIDVIKRNGESIRFQFTKKSLNNEEWEYLKDAELVLDTKNGTVSCKKKDLEKRAQALLDDALEARTTSDITNMVQKLFEKNADLFALRDQGGVYFVPQEHTEFTLKVGKFLELIGGSISRFPVPAGTKQGDSAVAMSIRDAIRSHLDELNTAIDEFTVNTRGNTLEEMAKRIRESRTKAEAYGHYLSSMSKEVLGEIDGLNAKLTERIETLAAEKRELPPGRETLLGHPVSAVIKWMGKNNWDFEDAKKVIKHFKLHTADKTIRGQLWCGSAERFGKAAELDDKEIKQLEKVRKP